MHAFLLCSDFSDRLQVSRALSPLLSEVFCFPLKKEPLFTALPCSGVAFWRHALVCARCTFWPSSTKGQARSWTQDLASGEIWGCTTTILRCMDPSSGTTFGSCRSTCLLVASLEPWAAGSSSSTSTSPHSGPSIFQQATDGDGLAR